MKKDTCTLYDFKKALIEDKSLGNSFEEITSTILYYGKRVNDLLHQEMSMLSSDLEYLPKEILDSFIYIVVYILSDVSFALNESDKHSSIDFDRFEALLHFLEHRVDETVGQELQKKMHDFRQSFQEKYNQSL